MVVATTRIISRINAIEFVAANPVGTLGVITPDTCNIIPINPIIDPPATRPEDRLMPFETLPSLSESLLAVFSTNTRIKAPISMIEVVEIGK